MGLTRITQAIEALEQAGLRAGRGFPGGGKPALTAPAVAVGIHRCEGESVTLAVMVFVTPEMGGSLCEDTALEAAAVLEGLGAACIQEACSYDRTTGLLSVRVLAAWGPEAVAGEAGGTEGSDQAAESGTEAALACMVTVGGTALSYLTAAKAEFTVKLYPVGAAGAGVGAVCRYTEYWDITVEELLPLSSVPAQLSTGTFTVQLTRSGGTECYVNCQWIRVLRQDTPQGIRQLRVARSYEERTVISA